MQLLLDVRGYSYIPDAAFAEIQAAVTRIVDIAAAAGYPLRADCVGTHPDTATQVTSLDPPTAICGMPDVTLHVYGAGFSATTVILFNGTAEPTVFVSPTEVTTGVKPSLATVAVTVPVTVVGASTSVDFTFVEPAARAAAAPPKGKT
jgi:hypothetical protein